MSRPFGMPFCDSCGWWHRRGDKCSESRLTNPESTNSTRSNSLRWLLLNSVYAAALVAAGLAYHGHLHPVALLAIGAVLGVYLFGSVNLLLGNQRHVSFAIKTLPMWAMLGTVAGFDISLGGTTSDVQQRVLGAASGLTATFLGISSMLVLMGARHWLTDEG